MRHILILLAALAAAPPPPSIAQSTVATPQRTARITITLPADDAALAVDGRTILGTSTSRTFEMPLSQGGETQRVTFTVTWEPNTYTTMTRTRVVTLRAGDPAVVDLSADDPTDRVRVLYVPTPEEVAKEMVTLAAVTRDDVVFEPGCGDARVTIAAVKAGARRGVGIDIAPEQVAESQAMVKAAGLTDRIEIRQGDALEIPDLASATVVFLYMGDHFNLLIRPALWRELPVGARIVSHRFKMGDWEPDRTIKVPFANGAEFELHLWVITEEVKKRAE
jgi:uncharacterized protein (TIGR03000 family)